MDSSVQYAECLVKKEYSGKEAASEKMKTVLICVAVAAVTLIICAFLPLLLPLIPIDAVLIIWVIHRLRVKLNTEFEYRAADGEMTVDRVILKSKRKEIISFDLSHCEIIAPYREKYIDLAERGEYDAIIDVSSSLSSPDIYFAVISEGNGDENTKTLVYFTPSEKFLKTVRFYNRRTVI